ncbi:MAG TPA: hypothetical protein VKG23_09435 [Thermoanaerobaculia bacterium]|nr:hypothetical protein [Thermoanaerobaculia bacterium]
MRRLAAVVGLAALGAVSCSYSSVTAGDKAPLPGFGCTALPKNLYPAADAAVRYMTAKVLVSRKDRPPIFLAVCGAEPPADILRSVEGFGVLPVSRAELYDAAPAPKVVIDRESGAAGVLMNIVGFRASTESACKLEVSYGTKHSILDLELSGSDDWSVSEDNLEPFEAHAPAGFSTSPA